MSKLESIIKKLGEFEQTLGQLSTVVFFLKKDNKKIRKELKECKYHREKLYEELVKRYESLKDERGN